MNNHYKDKNIVIELYDPIQLIIKKTYTITGGKGLDFLENEEMWTQRVIDEEPKLTDWFPADINPARKGTYQVINTEVVAWPFAAPQPVEANWSGKKWNTDNVLKWRGLAQDPKKA